MRARHIGITALSLLLALLAILPTRAQGPGPKGGPFIPGSPPPPTPPPSPAFRQAAEAALQAYLQAHGPAAPLARLLLNEQGHAVRTEEPTPLSPLDTDTAYQSIPEFLPDVASDMGTLSADPIQVLSGDGNYFLKVDLRDPRVRVRTMLANNDAGGLQTLSGIKARLENQGYAAWAVVNADLFSPNCPPGVNCGQGLTYIDGQHKPNWSAYGETWRVRGNIGFDSALNPEISVGDSQTRRYMVIAGGPRVLMGGGSPVCNPQYNHAACGSGKTYFPASGECFDGDVRYWCTDTRPITAVGYSSDGRYLYLGISTGGKTVTQLAQWLKDRGAYEVLRFDSGSSTGMYHNGQFIGGTGSKPIASALAVIVLPGSAPDTTPPSGDYTSPSNGATVGRTVHLAAWASDNQSGVREVHFTAKWSGQWHLVYNDTSAPYEYDWDLCASGVPDGDIELGLDIWDNAGNEFHLHTVHPNPHITKSYNCSPSSGTWSVDYWNNKSLAGYVNWHNNESGTYIFRDWGGGGPGDGIQSDEWSARFVRTVYFPGGDYRFHCHRDDGCRLYIDGQIRIDQWWDASFEGGDWGGYLSPGNHEVKVEYYENRGDARLEAWWQGPGFLPRDQDCDPNQWCAEYFGNRNLAGTPAIHRNEGESLWHDWGSAGPDPTFPTDAFSSRFTRNATFACGTYRFHLFTDDGVRFWVDNVLKLDQWRDQVASYDVDVALSSGSHALKVEHYENGGGAAIRVWWEKLADCQPAVAVDYASTHYVRPGASVDPTVRVRVTAGYLDGGRGDALTFVSGSALGASATQPVYGTVNEGSTYTFDVANSSGFRMTAPSAEGTYESRWQVKAAGSLIGPQATVRVVVDGTPPTIAIQSPTAGAYLNSNTVTVRATPQDASGIDQVQFFVGYNSGSGWAWQNLGWDLDGSDGWSRVWNAAGVADQAGVAFYAYAWDRAGNGAGTAVWDVTLDRTPPTTAIRPLVATQDSTAFIVWWEGSDNVSGVDHYDLQKRQDGGAWEDWHQGVGSQYVGAWFIGEMGHRYGFRMRGVDRAGNVEAYPGSAEAETYINYCSGDAYESDNGPAQARQIAVGQSQAHNFCGVDDQDWVKFWAWAGKRYVVQTGNLGWTGDTVLTLYDADGTTVLAENDDIAYPDNLASRVEWIAERDGWLYARVRHYNGRIAGNAVTYTLWLEEGYRAYLPLVLRKP
jgi:hypothetical protein